jgi:hypothetical protein
MNFLVTLKSFGFLNSCCKKAAISTENFFGQKPADFLTNFPQRPFYIERANDELLPEFYLKLPILTAQL